MGKDKASKRSRGSLVQDIVQSDAVKSKNRPEKERSRQSDHVDQYVGDKLSRKILDQALEQQDELEAEYGAVRENKGKKKALTEARTSLGGHSRLDTAGSDPESESDEEQFSEGEDQYYEDVVVDEEDEKALEMFMSKEPPQRRTLADIIMEKIKDKKTEIESQMSEQSLAPPMDERLVKVFKGVGDILSKYRSGKLPKAFKIIPSLQNWEEVVYVTNPETWTAAAMYQATRIFVSNLNAKMAQRFFNLVLLPRVRDDIAEYKRLNYHLYQALKKAFFKPAAFFKGILLPLCESGTCTLREAIIVGSVVTKTSIPVLHASAAMLKLAVMHYSGANSILLRLLLDKKYALPYRVIDAVVFHFLRFLSDKRTLPVLWHQSFLTFVQRYKEDISSEQKDALLEVCRVHTHDQITPEVRRELLHSSSRDVEVTNQMEYVGDKLSRKILDQALEQQDELEAEYGAVRENKGKKKALTEARTSLGGHSRLDTAGSDPESESDEEQFSEGEDQYYEDVITPEVRRELLHSSSRDVEVTNQMEVNT